MYIYIFLFFFFHVFARILDGRYEPIFTDNAYKVTMKLTIRSVTPADFGTYKCVSRNSLGDTDGSIKLYGKYFYK